MLDDMGSAHPPWISFAVMCAGGFPSSTLGCAGRAGAGSGAPQGLLSLPEPQGSNSAALFCCAAGDLKACGACCGAGIGADVVGEDRLNGELVLAVLLGGEAALVGPGFGGDAGIELANPPKSSAAKRSAGIDEADGLGGAAGWGAGAVCVNAKSKPLDPAEGEVTVGLTAGAFEGRESKKLPPLNGGGGGEAPTEEVDFGPELVRLPNAENAEVDCGWGGADVLVPEKFNPPKASAKPPKASCFPRGGDAAPPRDGWRSC